MARYTLPEYEHMDGWHCGSTALRNACRYVGVVLLVGYGEAAGLAYLSGTDRHALRAVPLEV
jgi:hypothetical protein